MVTARYHDWDRAEGKPRAVPGESPSGYVLVDPFEYVFRCRKCRPRRRVAFTPEQYAMLDGGALPVLDISYMD